MGLDIHDLLGKRRYTGATVSGIRRRQTQPQPPELGAAVARASNARGTTRSRTVLGMFAYLASIGLVAGLLVEPTGYSNAATIPEDSPQAQAFSDAQTIDVDESAQASLAAIARDGFDVIKPKPVAPAAAGGRAAPAAGTPDPGSAKAIAYDMVMARGWGEGEYDCLVALWNKESHWNVYAHNKSSGAYGIPQALPGSKMASAGEDWATNPVTQITWGLGYISGRYGTPCGAWGHSQAKNWY